MTSITNTITLEALEALALELEADDTAKRERLQRLIRAYARIIAVREPGQFRRRALKRVDEEGHFDSSYPPKQVFRDRNGPELFRVRKFTWQETPTSSGFYYTWEAAPGDLGVYVDAAGRIYGCEATGSGQVGQFAAHPGDHAVDMDLDWAPLRKPSLGDLEEAEEALRRAAFPHVAEAAEAAEAEAQT